MSLTGGSANLQAHQRSCGVPKQRDVQRVEGCRLLLRLVAAVRLEHLQCVVKPLDSMLELLRPVQRVRPLLPFLAELEDLHSASAGRPANGGHKRVLHLRVRLDQAALDTCAQACRNPCARMLDLRSGQAGMSGRAPCAPSSLTSMRSTGHVRRQRGWCAAQMNLLA